MTTRGGITRRDFIAAGALAGGGLVLAFALPRIRREAGGRALIDRPGFSPNAWLHIAPDDSVTILVDKSEMGQGVLTALPMILADELEADWTRVRAEHAPNAAQYRNAEWGVQATGGSTSVRGSWMPLRRAGAAAREMLVAAAAETWGVPPDECEAREGRVHHRPTGRSLRYGELATAAAARRVPRNPRLKSPRDLRLVGRRIKRLDTPAKVTGTATFGIDVRVPGMLVAVVERPPSPGATLASIDDSRARAVPGVRRIERFARGVAVVADGYWAAAQGRRALALRWDRGERGTLDSAGIARAFAERARSPLATAHATPATTSAAAATRRLSMVYELPFLAHAPMEPMNCTAHVAADRCDIWAPTQAQEASAREAQRITGLPPRAIHVHTTMLGGGFGRRAQTDFVAEAVELSKIVGAPVQVVWSREDDLRHGYFRPASRHEVDVELDTDGLPRSWMHRVVSSERDDPNAVESTAMLGGEFPYRVGARRTEFGGTDLPVRTGIWRSVGYSATAFVVESAIDEIAVAAGLDPLEMRRRLLDGRPRLRAVLDLAAERAGWGTPRPPGRALGLAMVECFGTAVAQVAEVSVSEGRVRVHRVVCAVDCGLVINPDIVEAQMQSGILFGLSAALGQEITLRDGAVEQSSFADYPVLRIDEAPTVEVHIVPSDAPPSGVGEPGTPPIAPAVANAVFAATGQRVRRLPMAVASSQ